MEMNDPLGETFARCYVAGQQIDCG